MTASFNRTQASAKAPGSLRMRRGFYTVLALLALCAAALVPSGAAHAADVDQIEVTMPTKVESCIMADGSVVGPTNWTIENNGTAIARLSGVAAADVYQGLTISATVEGESDPFFALSNDVADFKSIDVGGGNSVKVNWKFSKLDAKDDSSLIAESAKGAVSVANLSFSFACIQKQAFAVYSADDNSLNFYKRIDVPAEGETFDGRTATAVYTGIETAEYTGNPLPPWVSDHAGDIKRAEVVDDGLAPTSLACWFATLSNMETCDLSKLDTSRATSMFAMFDECPSLTSIDLSGFDTSNVTNMSYVFYNCSSLTSLELSNFSTGNVTDMSYMFDDCSSLTMLDLSRFDASNVTDMSYMFQGCSALASLDASRFDTGKVTNMAYMFDHCSSLASLDLSRLDTSNVADMSFMFYYCPSLTSLNLSGFATSGVTSMRDMFSGCENLASLDLSSFDTSNVADMSYMFQGCSKLASLDVSSFNTGKVTDMIDMFRGCGSLTELDLSGFDTSNAISKMGSMFYFCSSLAKVKLGEKWEWASNGLLPEPSDPPIAGADGKWYNSETDQAYAPAEIPSNTAATYMAVKPPKAFAVYSADGNSLNFYKRSDVPSVNDEFEGKTVTAIYTGIETVSSYTAPWYNNKSLIRSVAFVDDGIAPQYLNSWFCDFEAMESCDISKLDTSKATSMYRMFDGCKSLTSLDVSGFDTAKVTDMERMFCRCYLLTSLDVSKFNTSNVAYMQYMFDGCYSLTSLDVSGFDTAKVMDMQWMFDGCSALTSLDVSGFDTKNVGSMDSMYNVGSMDGMFRDCKSLTSLDLSNFNTAKVSDMQFMFNGCASLTSLDLSSFDMSMVTLAAGTQSMFNGCSKLATVKLGEGWKWVGSNGFLPAPSSEYITGANGKWYNSQTGTAFDPADIPSNTAATYVAVMPNDVPGNTPDALSVSKTLRDTAPANTQALGGGAQAAVALTDGVGASTEDAAGAAAGTSADADAAAPVGAGASTPVGSDADDANMADSSSQQAASSQGESIAETRETQEAHEARQASGVQQTQEPQQ